MSWYDGVASLPGPPHSLTLQRPKYILDIPLPLVVPIVCACPTAWGIGNLQAAAVEEEPCPSAVGSMSPGAVKLVEEEAFDHFRRLISVEAAVFNSELFLERGTAFLLSLPQPLGEY